MQKETLTITRVFRGKKQTKFGEKDSIGIKTTKYGDKWLSSFKTQGTEKWAENDTVDIYVEEKNGYLNFTLNEKVADLGAEAVAKIYSRLDKLENKVFGGNDIPYDGF